VSPEFKNKHKGCNGMEKRKLDNLRELVETFEQKIDEVKNSAYNEDNLRVDFVDKFFEYVLK
jgi:hypothetical protein